MMSKKLKISRRIFSSLFERIQCVIFFFYLINLNEFILLYLKRIQKEKKKTKIVLNRMYLKDCVLLLVIVPDWLKFFDLFDCQ